MGNFVTIVKGPSSNRAEMVSPTVDAIAGFASGSCSIAAGQPFDTVKVRMQTQTPRLFRSTLHCFSDTIQVEGWRALCKGMLSPLLTASAINALLFPSFNFALGQFNVRDAESASTAQLLAAGGFAGIAQCIIATPSELVKCKLQINTGQYRGNMDCLQKVVAAEGPRGLYKGNLATMLREGPAFAIWFTVYHRVVKMIDASDEPAWWASAMAGAVTGVATWTSIYPVDVVKSMVQTLPEGAKASERNLAFIVRQMVKKGGVRSLYAGLGATLMRSLPVNVVTFPVYEAVVKAMPSDE